MGERVGITLEDMHKAHMMSVFPQILLHIPKKNAKSTRMADIFVFDFLRLLVLETLGSEFETLFIYIFVSFQ